jgi:hypothetical protein
MMAAVASVIATEAVGPDRVWLGTEDGGGYDGRVSSLANGKLRVLIKSEHGEIGTEVPLSDVASIRVHNAAVLGEKLRSQAGKTQALGAAWDLWSQLVAVPGNPAAEVGDVYAKALVSESRHREAVAVYQLLGSKHPSVDVRRNYRRAEIEMRLANEPPEKAETLAREIIGGGSDTELLLLAHRGLAEALHRRLLDFLKDNPRWKDDPLALEEHDKLFNGALNSALFSFARFAHRSEEAARGLLTAARIRLDTGHAQEARSDLVLLKALYPSTGAARQADALSISTSTNIK